MGFEWLDKLAEYLAAFVPRLAIVDTTHGAVKFRYGKQPIALKPGLHFYWPLVTKFVTYPTARQSTDLRTVTTVTSDNVTLLVGGMIVYEIEDIGAIVAHTWDPDNTINDLAISAIADVVCGRYTYQELLLKRHNGELEKELFDRLKADLEDYGVRVLTVRLPDMCPTTVVKMVGGVPTMGTGKPGDS